MAWDYSNSFGSGSISDPSRYGFDISLYSVGGDSTFDLSNLNFSDMLDVSGIVDPWMADFTSFVSDIRDEQAKWENKSKWYQDYKDDLSRGDGNAAVEDIIKGVKDGSITKEEATELAKTVQQEANANGGGKIKGSLKDELAGLLGENYVANGKTRGQLFFENLFSF
jgi:hypothetical protein